MTRKISFGVVTIMLVAAVVLSSLVTLIVVFTSYDNLLLDLPQRADQYKKLTEIDELIRSEYYGKFDSDSVDDSLASGLLYSLNDNFSYYVSSDDYSEYSKLISGKASGIGINVYYDSSLGQMIISNVSENSPADSKGLKVSDVIASVNGKPVTQENADSLTSVICDSFKKDVTLDVIDASGNSSQYKVTSGYDIESCFYKKDGSVGYIRLTAVYDKTVDDFIAAINSFREEKINTVILDLRNCSSVNFDAAAKIIDYIVPVGTEGTGVIYSAKNSKGEVIMQYPSSSDAVNITFAVLVNTRTEGAAELIACDLKDFGKGYLFGEKTAGHGTMQKVFEIRDGGYVILTVAEIFPYLSSSYNDTGIMPDVEILTSDAFKDQIGRIDSADDEQYQKAYNYLTGK